MAGDWIPIRLNLHEDPAVFCMAERLNLNPFEVVGRLVRVWGWANQHTSDGTVEGVSEQFVDEILIKTPGFCAAMIAAGWLRVSGGRIEFPRFARYMGNSAKSRLSNAERQRVCRDRASQSGRTPIPRPMRRDILERDARTCVYCGQAGDRHDPVTGERNQITIDHVTPCSAGGPTAPDNLAACCMGCNNEKNGRTPEEWGVLPQHLQPGITYANGRILASVKAGHKTVTRRRDKSATTEQNRTEQSMGDVSPIPPSAAVQPRPRDELFDALADVTGSDPATAGGHVAKVKAALLKAAPPYTAADVREFGRRFAELCGWGDGRLPTVGEVEKYIGRIRAPTPPPASGRRTKGEIQDGYAFDILHNTGDLSNDPRGTF